MKAHSPPLPFSAGLGAAAGVSNPRGQEASISSVYLGVVTEPSVNIFYTIEPPNQRVQPTRLPRRRAKALAIPAGLAHERYGNTRRVAEA